MLLIIRSVSESVELLRFLKDLPAEEVSKRTGFKHSVSGMISFCPNFDGEFFPKPLDELREEAPKKPVMIGVTEHEGLLFGSVVLLSIRT